VSRFWMSHSLRYLVPYVPGEAAKLDNLVKTEYQWKIQCRVLHPQGA